jgi:hypothetical protein
MTTDEYLKEVLSKYSACSVSTAKNKALPLLPTIKKWAGEYLYDTILSGSFAKDTAISVGTDCDVFISIMSTVPNSLSEIYELLFRAVTDAGFQATKQNVSIGINLNGHKIDLVPAKRQSQRGNDHSLWMYKQQTWTKTNIETHIAEVRNSGRTNEIKLLKIWRHVHKLEFPSFYLELVAIKLLKGSPMNALTGNFYKVLEFLGSNKFSDTTFYDPANGENVISEDISNFEKSMISLTAFDTLQKGSIVGWVW